MAMFIFLDANQADTVRGPSTPYASLNPIKRANDIFLLGVAVLTDPAHKAHWSYLAALPQMDSDDPDFPLALPEMYTSPEL